MSCGSVLDHLHMPPVLIAQSLDSRIADVTTVQYGVIHVRQLLAVGLSHGQIATRVKNGRLVRIHHGVYAIAGMPLTDRGRMMAAVLAGNEGTVLFGASALANFNVLKQMPAVIDIVSPGTTPKIEGVRTHRSRWFPESQRTQYAGIATSNPSRAFVDYAYESNVYDLAGVLHELDHLRRLDIDAIAAYAQRLEHRRGTTDIDLAIEHYAAGSRGAYSDPERFMLLAIRAAGLPLPIANLPLDTPRGRFVMDAYWPGHHCAYELDWRQDHARPSTRARDKAREAAYEDARIPFIRIDIDVMYADVDRQVARVATLLGL